MSALRGRSRYPAMQAASYVLLTFISILIVYPYLLMFAASFTDNNSLVVRGYRLFSSDFSLDAYEYLWAKRVTFARAYGITLFVTTGGTALSLLMTALFAYAISRSDFRGRRFLTFFIFFTMLFNGGFVSSYILWTNFINIKNTLWAYIIPNMLLNAMNVLIMKNYFKNNIPESVLESGKLDGAGEFRIFFRLVMPMALPISAAIGLLIALSFWNNWQNGLYFIKATELYSYQNLLNRMIRDIQYLASEEGALAANITFPGASIRMAIATLAVVPILALYPFFQKYFIKGLTMGSVKE